MKDLHGIDTETYTLLDSLVESLPTGGFHLLVNDRCQEVAYLPFLLLSTQSWASSSRALKQCESLV
jgi:hypothetical protein